MKTDAFIMEYAADSYILGGSLVSIKVHQVDYLCQSIKKKSITNQDDIQIACLSLIVR